MDDSFSRVGSTRTLPSILEHTAQLFALGTVVSFVPITTGYQDYNVELTTTNGKYVVKIFAADRSKQRIDDVIRAHTASAKLRLPVPGLLETADKRKLIDIPGKTHPIYLCVFEYFPGKPFTRTPVTDTDLVTLTRTMSAIHRIQGVIHPYYDSLGIINLPEEFKTKKSALNSDELTAITPVVTKLGKINLSLFPRSIIHGTFEKENILKSATGEICILDFGCMDYQASILDIATFIANFTLYVDTTKRSAIIRTILDTYEEKRPLTKDEIAALPTLIRSQFAAYAIGMSYHMRIEHDMTKQTQTWLDRGWDGLRAYAAVKKIL